MAWPGERRAYLCSCSQPHLGAVALFGGHPLLGGPARWAGA